MAAKTAIVRDIPMHYEEIGEGRPVVLLHGFSMEHRFMTHVYEPIFAARAGTGPDDGPGLRRIYLDMPGHGATPAPDWLTSDDQVLDLLMEFITQWPAGNDWSSSARPGAGTTHAGWRTDWPIGSTACC